MTHIPHQMDRQLPALLVEYISSQLSYPRCPDQGEIRARLAELDALIDEHIERVSQNS